MRKHKDDHASDAGTASILSYNEERANHYAALCLLVSAGVTALMWLLNVVGVFIVDQQIMNIFMPIGMVILILPYAVMKLAKLPQGIIKYMIILCFLLGIGIMSTSLTMHMVLAWACPILLSCHYYSPKFTRITLVGVLIFILISIYVGLYFGVWDSNMMSANMGNSVNSFAQRVDYIAQMKAEGNDILKRTFIFYYLPRAVICIVVFLIGNMLSRRTQGLLNRQCEITQEKERIGAELDIAKHIQTSMLPCLFPAFPEHSEFDIFATMEPAREVGGDFYDFFMVDDRHLAMVMADVSGKGVPAALFMVIGKTLIKDHTQPDRDLGEVFSRVNDLLCQSNSEGLFITAFECVLDIATGEMVYVNAGHEPPFVCHAGGNFEKHTVRPGFVLAGMEGMKYRVGKLTLSPGDTLFLYTDGVTEATNAKDQLYGMDRLGAALCRAQGGKPTRILEDVRRDVDAFVDGAPQFDDITMLCLQFKEYRKETSEHERVDA